MLTDETIQTERVAQSQAKVTIQLDQLPTISVGHTGFEPWYIFAGKPTQQERTDDDDLYNGPATRIAVVPGSPQGPLSFAEQP